METIAQDLKCKQLVIGDAKVAFAFANSQGWKGSEWVYIKKESDLKPYHFAPVRNCAVHVLGNHPVIGTREFIRLFSEKL
jgi:hypothetical protein